MPANQASATVADVERIAMALPEVEESTWFRNQAWKVRSKAFVWLRPLRNKDLEELGGAAPTGPVVGVRVADADDKRAVIEAHDPVFTIDHFRNFDAVLIDLERIGIDDLAELITDAWLCQAPADVAAAFLGRGADAALDP